MKAASPDRAIAVVIVNYRTAGLVASSLYALSGERTSNPTLRAIVVDGGSNDDSVERLTELIAKPSFRDWVTLLPLGINGGFGWANNQAIQRLLQSSAPPAYVHLLNPDAVINAGAVTALAAVLDNDPRCAAVGSLLLELDGQPTGSAFNFPSVRTEFGRGLPMAIVAKFLGTSTLAAMDHAGGEVDWVTGASTMLRSAALREVGLFDTGFFLYFEELELMWRLSRGGWTIRHEPKSQVRHIGGAATGINKSGVRDPRPALPAYWYQSRRRFLALTVGSSRAVAASLAYLAGHVLLIARRCLGSGRQHMLTYHDARGMLACGLLPSANDGVPAFSRWDDVIDLPPVWMTRNETHNMSH